MNYPSEEFILIDKWKWNDIPAYGVVERNSLEWKISKMVTNWVRHCDLANREIDGAFHLSSLCSNLRRGFESESEGTRTFSDSQWLGYIRGGSNKPRFQCCTNSNKQPLVCSRHPRSLRRKVDCF